MGGKTAPLKHILVAASFIPKQAGFPISNNMMNGILWRKEISKKHE
jgi:hypothetical protein